MEKMTNIFKRDKYLLVKYIIFVILFSTIIGLFSVIMSAVTSSRSDIYDSNYSKTSQIYGGSITQASPSLMALEAESDVYKTNNLTPVQTEKYIDNAELVSTTGNVVINAEFVKKGLSYQPTYKTQFQAEYTLKNTLDEKSFVAFEFPFPSNTYDSEISNAQLFVNGNEIKNAKTSVYTPPLEYNTYNDYNSYNSKVVTDKTKSTTQGLKWEGEIAANSEALVKVTYNTVGLSYFTYEGLENKEGAQDFKFTVQINGIRSYDIVQGLSVDDREFGSKSATLKWDKQNLYSKPVVSVEVGDRLNPSKKVARVYMVMTPVYIIAIIILLFLAYRFGRKLRVFDLFLVTILYTLYFPLVHYLSSFTIDPTMEVFADIDSVPYFSMPLYGAFLIAWLAIGGMMYYLFGRLSGFKFANKFVIPSLILFLGFFPLVLTVPEYSILLSLIGLTALMAIIIQSRIRIAKKEATTETIN